VKVGGGLAGHLLAVDSLAACGIQGLDLGGMILGIGRLHSHSALQFPAFESLTFGVQITRGFNCPTSANPGCAAVTSKPRAKAGNIR
jgi:hypothetical protein